MTMGAAGDQASSSTTTSSAAASQLASLAAASFAAQFLLLFLADVSTSGSPAAVQLASLAFPVCARLFLGADDLSVSWRAAVLGTCAALGAHVLLVSSAEFAPFGWYLFILAFFHLSEYLATALTNPDNLSTDSFLLNHSTAYHAAAVLSWAEFLLEAYFLGGTLKTGYLPRAVSLAGLALCAGGEVLRKLAMLHAGRSFNHIVQMDLDEDEHKLVTDGVFGLVRHPSYVGWFYWSIGTQLVLCNPVCTLAYAAASWQFFRERVVFEEWTLLRTYRGQYEEYMQRVPTGLPFIKGYHVHRN